VTNRPLFTVVMPVFLGEYTSNAGKSAKDKPSKFHRAVESVMGQTFKQWELVIVVDGCLIAEHEAQRYAHNPAVRVLTIDKQRTWSPAVRNAGLKAAIGNYAIYLDADDCYGPGHLETVAGALQEAGWPIWGAMDEWVWDAELDQWKNRMVSQLFANKKEHGWHAGTPNIVHRTDLALLWPAIEFRYPNFGYAREDRAMVKELQARGEGAYIPGAEYYVCHIPGPTGYDR